MEDLISLCRRHKYSNGWYHVRNDRSFCNTGSEGIADFSLCRQDGSLVADNLEKCDVYQNGWFSLQRDGVVVLYRSDEQPEYIGVTSITFSPSGKFVVEQGRDKIALHDCDGRLIANSLRKVHIFDDGSYVFRKEGESKCKFFSAEKELLAEYYALDFYIKGDEVSLYLGWDDDPRDGLTFEWNIYRKDGTFLRKKISQE